MPILMKPVSAMEKCFMDESFDSKKAISAGKISHKGEQGRKNPVSDAHGVISQ